MRYSLLQHGELASSFAGSELLGTDARDIDSLLRKVLVASQSAFGRSAMYPCQMGQPFDDITTLLDERLTVSQSQQDIIPKGLEGLVTALKRALSLSRWKLRKAAV